MKLANHLTNHGNCTRYLIFVHLANPPLLWQCATAQAHLAFKGNWTWHSDWFSTRYLQKQTHD